MTMITPSYLGETIEYSSLHACRSTLEDPTYIDSTGWGCGTKLPHNVTSLLGVMDGAASDLRPGLPWQGVEIHEPVRLMFIFETTPEVMRKIMKRNENIGRILRNEWARLSVLSPESGAIQVYRDGEFQEYVPTNTQLRYAPSSTAWYQGHREHLPFAVIGVPTATETSAHNETEPCLTTSSSSN